MHFVSITELDLNKTMMNPEGRTFGINGIYHYVPIHNLNRTDNNEHGTKKGIQYQLTNTVYQ